jgi:glycosyltransferase involved in cell wall biosynthesis
MTDFSNFVNELNTIIQPQAQVQPQLEAQPDAQPNRKTVTLLIVSTHACQVNGYSKVIYNLIQQLALQPWLKIVHFGTQKLINADIGRTYPPQVRVIDATAREKEKQPGFAFGELPAVIQAEKPDIVFIYNDLSVICTYIEQIRKSIDQRTFKIWAYVDLTYLAPPQPLIDILNRDVERIFCFTKSWKKALVAQGMTRPVDVLPHAASSAMLRPIPRDMARQTLGLPKDVFLFLSINKNIPRKRLDLLIVAFVKLMVRFPMKQIYMMLVADKGERGGFPLFDIFAREIKLQGGSVDMYGNRLLITSKDTCYKDDDINLLYNCGDACVSCAEGEGFGLCSFEPMWLGIPQIVPDMNGYTEYCTEENSILVKPKLRYYIPQAHSSVMGEAQLVDPEDVAKAMERYVFDEELRKRHAQKGKEKAAEYTWEKCAALMVKRLSAVHEDED